VRSGYTAPSISRGALAPGVQTATIATLIFALSAAAAHAQPAPPLKDAFAEHFRIGAAVSTPQALGDQPPALQIAARHFNTITSENLLKWAEVHPEPSRYNFDPADKFVAFGQEHGMFIVGHTLVWHNQTPTWVFEDDAGQPLTRDALIERMRQHIHAVVGRYKGKIHGWDVVNEAFEDDGALRDSLWRRIIGDDYLELAFRFAHEADPHAELYYNDYNEWHPGKRKAVGALVRSFKANGVPIHGIGMQGHWGLDYPSLAEIDAMLNDYGQLGVKLMVTELDMNILPRPGAQTAAEVSDTAEGGDAMNPYAAGLPAAKSRELADRYAAIFRLFAKHQDKIDRVTFWGVHDGQSWLNNWPIRGRTAHPLLFDRKLQPKPAFNAVIEAANSE
jgi:endo-1,4-beta-xylanase